MGDSSVSPRMTLRGTQSEHKFRRLVILPGQRDEAEARAKSRVPPKGSMKSLTAALTSLLIIQGKIGWYSPFSGLYHFCTFSILGLWT